MRWRQFRSLLQSVHLWLALILSLPMIVIGLTGSALLVQREILALSVPGATTPGVPRPIAEIVAAAEERAPEGMAASRIDVPRGPGWAATVRFTPSAPAIPEHDIYVDPVSLQILGDAEVIERGPILALLIETHAFLQMPPHIGLPFVGFVGVIMTFMGLSGLVLWWPAKGQWRKSFGVRRGARGLLFHRDLHHAAGIWGVLVLLLVSVSGIYLTFPQTIGPYVQSAFPSEPVTIEPPPDFVPHQGPIGPEEAIAIALEVVPNARALGLQFGRANAAFVVDLEPTGWSSSLPLALVSIDRTTAEVLYIEDPRTYPLPEKVLNSQFLIHFGVGLGWFWKIMVFFSGLLPTLLAVTGVMIWWKKRKARQAM